MLSFSKVTLKDREKLLHLLMQKDRGCEYSFANIYLYRHFYNTQVAFLDGGAVVRYGDHGSCLMPMGFSDLAAVIEQIPVCSDGSRKLIYLTEEDVAEVTAALPGRNIEVSDAGYPEYVYRSSDLADLPGKKYHSKRNFCHRFESTHPDYTYEVITDDNIEDVCNMNAAWYYEMRDSGRDLVEDEACATGCLREYKELGLIGGLLRCSGRVVAWCCGEKLADGAFCTHVEKALREMDGAYAVINRDLARAIRDEFEYINREDDAGDEGLIKAKMSYSPVYLRKKYLVSIL